MAEYCTCDVEVCEMHTLKEVAVSSSDLATLRAEVEELRKDRERLRELEAYQEQTDTLWAEYIQKRLPGFEALCDFVLDPAHKEIFEQAIEAAAKGGE